MKHFLHNHKYAFCLCVKWDQSERSEWFGGEWAGIDRGQRSKFKKEILSMCLLRLGHPGFGMLASASATGTWRWHTPQWPYPSRWEAVERERHPRRSPGGRRAVSGRRSRSLSFLGRDREKTKGQKRGQLCHLIRLHESTMWWLDYSGSLKHRGLKWLRNGSECLII